MDRFYNDLQPFQNFDAFSDMAAYDPVPDDWVVLIADVKGSTEAIEAGKYKDVNIVGAACVTAILNICGDIEVPFVFGGDGAAVVLPGDLASSARDVLQGLRRWSADRFGLELRAGLVSVADLRARNVDLKVRKFELSPGNYLAMFAGHGMELADALLKDPRPDNRHIFGPADNAPYPDLSGLSCRWEPLKPQGGQMMSLMVRAVASDPQREQRTLSDAAKEIAGILGGDLRGGAPVGTRKMKLGRLGRALRTERLANWRPGLNLRLRTKQTFEYLVQALCERFNIKIGPYDPPAYHEALRRNTDFRKYDDVLRMVLDVTPSQVALLRSYCQEKYDAGLIVFGIHLADSALMTCLVFNLEQGEHIHFIDGNDGGFALAAKDFKARLPDAK